MKYLRWLISGVLGLMVLAMLTAAGLWLFLPDRYVVNTPVLALFVTQPLDREAMDSQLQLPDGFSLSVYATGLDGVRVMRATSMGDLIVSTPRTSQVWLLRQHPGGMVEKQLLLDDLNRPHGIEVHDGWLYVAETDAVGRAKFDAQSGTVTEKYRRIITDIPAGGMHWTRTIRRGPDGWFYLTVGSNCNACEDGPGRAAMHRFNADGSGFETFATGLRNAVDFDWAPWDGALYATDNGRDLLGDDLPPCELNRVVKGGFYGWPYSWGDRQPDAGFGTEYSVRVKDSIGPVHGFKAHTAPLGISFLNSENLPAEFRRSALVAQHGSWNRTRKAGYRLVSLHWDDAGVITERDFLTGFEVDESVMGRPAFVAQGPDGAIYISDDFSGSIYRVVYGEQAAAATLQPIVTAEQRPVETLPPASAEQIARGSQLYQQYDCASCHDPERAVPGVVTVPLNNLPDRYTRRSLADFFVTPTPPMPAYPLNDEDRQAIASYLLN